MKNFRFVELKDLYDLFVDTTFCEDKNVIVRMHVYEDFDSYEEYDDPNKAIYYQSCETYTQAESAVTVPKGRRWESAEEKTKKGEKT